MLRIMNGVAQTSIKQVLTNMESLRILGIKPVSVGETPADRANTINRY